MIIAKASTAQTWQKTMTVSRFECRPRRPFYDMLQVPTEIWRANSIALTSVEMFGGWELMMFFATNADISSSIVKADRSQSPRNSARIPVLFKRWLRELCRPTSFYIDLHVSSSKCLRHNTTWHQRVPHLLPFRLLSYITGALVKLFAVSVTTMDVHGHLGSLIDWRTRNIELFRMVELMT